MRFASPSRFYFFFGWTAWLASAWSLIAAELLLRRLDQTQPYRLEAYCAMLAPLLVIALADRWSMRHYGATWRLLGSALGTLVVDGSAIDSLREDLIRLPVLAWAAPPEHRSSAQQLAAAASWLPALVTPSGGPGWRRFGEWVLDGLALFLLPVGAAVALAVLDRPPGPAIGLLLAAASLALLGSSLIRLAGRRQALADYFRAWQVERGAN